MASRFAPTKRKESRLRARLLDFLVPALSPPSMGGPAFFAYDFHKSSIQDGVHVCPLVDPLIKEIGEGPYTNVVIGVLSEPEKYPSINVPRRLNPFEFLMSVFFFEKNDLVDFRFIKRLYDSKLTNFKATGWPYDSWLYRRLFALRNFLLARYFALKYRKIAEECESAHVVVYYNAIMLGVVRAFRRLGKEVWDIQHGYNGEDHPAYNSSLAFRLDSTCKPSGFLVWEAKFGAALESAIGATWRSTNYHHLVFLTENDHANRKGFSVMYSLQWRVPVSQQVQDAVSHFRERISWSFRLHPFEYDQRDDLKWIRDSRYSVITDSSEPLAVALGSCDLHITHNSGVTHEAAALGKPTFFLDRDLTQRVEDEIRAGIVRFVDDGELIDALEHQFHTASADVDIIKKHES